MVLNKSQYAAYIASDAWRKKRQLVLERDNYQCRTCENTEHLEIHHRHYRTLGEESLDDLITLCTVCHEAITNVQRREKWQKFDTVIVETVTTRITRYGFSESTNDVDGGSSATDAQWVNGRSGKPIKPRYERDFSKTEES